MKDTNLFPNRITIELTNRCNLLCSFCPRHHVDIKQGDIEDSLFYKIIDECSNHLPISIVMFLRGESLLHPKPCKYIKYAKNKGIAPIQLASNGLLLDEKMADCLIESGLDFISFSLDTLDEDIYKKTRKNGDLKKSINNIIAFCNKCKDIRKKGLKTPEIQISTVEIEEYKDKQQEFIDFWQKHVDRVRVYVEHSTDGKFGSLGHEYKQEIERKACQKVYTDMIIYWDGTVALCNHDWDNKMKIGNANQNSIKEIWNSENYIKIRQMHEKNSFSDNCVCKTCDHWQMYYQPEGYLGKVYEK